MNLVLKEKLSLFQNSYEIKDQKGTVLYTAKRTVFSGNVTTVFDRNGNQVASLKRVTYSAIAACYELFIGGEYRGTLKRELHSFRPEFTLNYNGWKIEGDIMHWDFGIYDEKGHNVAYITSKFLDFSDTYSLNIAEDKDALNVILIVLALDFYIASRR